MQISEIGRLPKGLVHATLQRKPRDSKLSRLVTTRITLTIEQWIDVQGHSRSLTFVAIESPYSL